MKQLDIIKAIEAHSDKYNLKKSSIGQYAVSNRKIYENMKNGSDIQIGTAERILSWIDADAARREQGIEATQ